MTESGMRGRKIEVLVRGREAGPGTHDGRAVPAEWDEVIKCEGLSGSAGDAIHIFYDADGADDAGASAKGDGDSAGVRGRRSHIRISPDRVEVRHIGEAEIVMDFAEGETTRGSHSSKYGTLTFGIETERITREEPDGGIRLTISYKMTGGGAPPTGRELEIAVI